MAAGFTKTAQQAISMVKILNHNVPPDILQADACHSVMSWLWAEYPWTWTQSQLTAITLSDGVQDYAHAQTDLFRIVNLRLARTDLSPVKYQELNQKTHLGVELERKAGIDGIRNFSVEPAINKIRLDYAASIGGTAVLALQGEYQRDVIPFAEDNLDQLMDGTNACKWPDRYFHVFMEGVRWYFYQMADDPRSGAIQYSNGRAVYTGQLGVFMNAFDRMIRAEDFSDGEDLNFPSEPYGATTQGSGWGIYPG